MRTIVVPAGGIGGARFLRGLLAAAVRPAHRGHGHRQHRRRHHAVRPAGLPRPRHRDVHPRRRHPRGAGLGPGRRDLRGARRAGRLRRRAAVVRARRPRPRHPRRCAPRCSTPATRSARSPQALCARWGLDRPGRPAAADERRPGRDPRGHRRPRRRPAGGGRCTSRSTGCGCTPSRPPTRSSPVGAEQARPGPGVLEAVAAADLVLLPPSNPVVSIGTVLAVPGIREALAADAGTGRRPVADRRRRTGARHGRQGARRDRRARARRPRWRCTTAAGRRRAARRLAGRRAATRTRWPTVEAAGISCRAVPLLMPDSQRAADMARAALELCRRRCGRGPHDPASEVWAPDGVPEVAAGDDLAALLADALRGDPRSPTATSSWSPPRSVSKAEGRVVRDGPRRGGRPPRPCGSWPAAGRPGSSRPGTASCSPPPGSTRAASRPGRSLLLPGRPGRLGPARCGPGCSS